MSAPFPTCPMFGIPGFWFSLRSRCAASFWTHLAVTKLIIDYVVVLAKAVFKVLNRAVFLLLHLTNQRKQNVELHLCEFGDCLVLQFELSIVLEQLCNSAEERVFLFVHNLSCFVQRRFEGSVYAFERTAHSLQFFHFLRLPLLWHNRRLFITQFETFLTLCNVRSELGNPITENDILFVKLILFWPSFNFRVQPIIKTDIIFGVLCVSI
jgi:hypothetical protein